MQRALEMLDSGVPVPLLCKVAVCQPSECIVSVQVGQWSGSAQVLEVLHFERDLPQVDVQLQALHCVLVGMETTIWAILLNAVAEQWTLASITFGYHF